jgi:hypothetical protein
MQFQLDHTLCRRRAVLAEFDSGVGKMQDLIAEYMIPKDFVECNLMVKTKGRDLISIDGSASSLHWHAQFAADMHGWHLWWSAVAFFDVHADLDGQVPVQ